MKTAQAERRAVVRIVTALALAHWEVRWQLRDDGETLLDLMPADSLPARARELLGGAVMDHLARFEKESGGFSVAGLASRPTWLRGNREQQFVYVNRRPVESPTLLAAISQAYKEVVPPGKFPVVVAFLQVPPGEVDVNVHPAKTEVRMLLERQVFGLLKQALQDGLDLRAADHLRPFADQAADPALPPVPGFGGARRHQRRRARRGRLPARPLPARRLRRLRGQGPARRPGRALRPRRPARRGGGPGDGRARRRPRPRCTRRRTGSCTAPTSSPRSAAAWCSSTSTTATSGSSTTRPSRRSRRTRAASRRSSCSSRRTSTCRRRSCRPTTSGTSELARLGFLIQPFGGQSVLVQGIPASLKNWQEGRLLLDMLDDLGLDDRPSQEQQVDLLASFACHGAIRAGEPLTLPEMQNLVDQLFATDLPLSCPHGRPTLVHFTLEELERRFGRRT